MKQLRKEKQREEEEVLQREDIGEKCGTRGEFIELQRSQEQRKRGKSTEKREERVSFGGGGCGGFVGHVSPGCQGPLVWWTMGGGRTRAAVAQEEEEEEGEEEEEDGAKQGLSLIRVSPFFYPHRLKLPQIPLTRNPAECSQSPESQLT